MEWSCANVDSLRAEGVSFVRRLPVAVSIIQLFSLSLTSLSLSFFLPLVRPRQWQPFPPSSAFPSSPSSRSLLRPIHSRSLHKHPRFPPPLSLLRPPMPAQPAPFTSLMPYTHRPRRRSRRPRTLAALLICSCLALATTSATAAVESVPPQPALGWRDSLPEQSVGRDSLGVHLQARAASSAMGNSASTSTRKASSSAAVKTSSTTAAATAATSAAIVLADGTNSVSSIAADGALAVSSESAAMVTTGTGTLTSTSSAAVSTSTAVPAGYAIPEAFECVFPSSFSTRPSSTSSTEMAARVR